MSKFTESHISSEYGSLHWTRTPLEKYMFNTYFATGDAEYLYVQSTSKNHVYSVKYLDYILRLDSNGHVIDVTKNNKLMKNLRGSTDEETVKNCSK